MPFFVLTTYQSAWAFRCDQGDIQVRSRRNLSVVHCETVREEQQCAFVDIVDDGLVQSLLDHIRGQEHDDRSTFDGFVRFLDGQAVGLCVGPACAALAQPDNDIESRVLQVERVSATLATVAKNRNLLVRQNGDIYICFRIHLHAVSCALDC